jgi:hypothetical protein
MKPANLPNPDGAGTLPSMSIPRRERFKLIGTYRTPRFGFHQRVMDDVRGWVEIVGITDAPIPWPIGKRNRARLHVVYGELTKALRRESNQAICHAWGVTAPTVAKWRKALGIERETEGCRRLRRLNALSPEFVAIRKKAHAKNQDPGRRAKISAAKLGIPRPASVIIKLRLANLGKKASKETRRRMSEAHRKRGSLAQRDEDPHAKREDQILEPKGHVEAVHEQALLCAVVKGRVVPVFVVTDFGPDLQRRSEVEAEPNSIARVIPWKT